MPYRTYSLCFYLCKHATKKSKETPERDRVNTISINNIQCNKIIFSEQQNVTTTMKHLFCYLKMLYNYIKTKYDVISKQ